MAKPGLPFNQTADVAAPPDSASQSIVAAAASAPGYTLTSAGPGSIILTRHFWKTSIIVWSIVLAVLLFLLGLLLLLIRTSETLTITLTPTATGTRVIVSGIATPEMMQRVNSAIASMAVAAPAAPSTLPPTTPEPPVTPRSPAQEA